MTVIRPDTALFAAFKFIPGGTKMTVYTDARDTARTTVVAELEKEFGAWADWKIVRRPASADASLLPHTSAFGDPAVITSKDLARCLNDNHDLWADVAD